MLSFDRDVEGFYMQNYALRLLYKMLYIKLIAIMIHIIVICFKIIKFKNLKLKLVRYSLYATLQPFVPLKGPLMHRPCEASMLC